MKVFDGVVNCAQEHFKDIYKQARMFSEGNKNITHPPAWEKMEEAIEALTQDLKVLMNFHPDPGKHPGAITRLPKPNVGKWEIHNAGELR